MKKPFENEQEYLRTKNLQVTTYKTTKKLVIGSVLAAIATLLQSMGVIIGFGFAFSILATLPIVLSAMISLRIGFMSYLIAIILLFILQPSELFVFPFTTGLLGIALGTAFKWSKNLLTISIVGGTGLSLGIMFLLYVIKFPVLGPGISHSFDFKMITIILTCSIIYSFVWTALSRRVFSLLFRDKGNKSND